MQAGKVRSLAEAIRLISDGTIVALGGADGRRLPMAAVREIVRQRCRDLQIVAVSENPGLALLDASGCAASTDAAAANGLRAAALGLSMLPLRDDDGTPAAAYIKPFTDPFTGRTILAVAALVPDVAILHAHRADATGNVQISLDRTGACAADLMLARAARIVIVTVEQIVSAETIASWPADTVLLGADVTCVVEAPFGSHPFALENRYAADIVNLQACMRATADRASLDTWLADQVTGCSDHWDYLNRVGARVLMAVSINRVARA